MGSIWPALMVFTRSSDALVQLHGLIQAAQAILLARKDQGWTPDLAQPVRVAFAAQQRLAAKSVSTKAHAHCMDAIHQLFILLPLWRQ